MYPSKWLLMSFHGNKRLDLIYTKEVALMSPYILFRPLNCLMFLLEWAYKITCVLYIRHFSRTLSSIYVVCISIPRGELKRLSWLHELYWSIHISMKLSFSNFWKPKSFSISYQILQLRMFYTNPKRGSIVPSYVKAHLLKKQRGWVLLDEG